MRVDEFLRLCIALRLDPRSFVTREMVEEVAEATRRSVGRSGQKALVAANELRPSFKTHRNSCELSAHCRLS